MSTDPGTTSTLSTHVLDAALGEPAVDLEVVLADAGGTVLETARTDADGRHRFAVRVAPGTYRLTVATGPWYAARDRATFHPEVVLVVAVEDRPHHHVALLLSPYAYTTYRGS